MPSVLVNAWDLRLRCCYYMYPLNTVDFNPRLSLQTWKRYSLPRKAHVSIRMCISDHARPLAIVETTTRWTTRAAAAMSSSYASARSSKTQTENGQDYEDGHWLFPMEGHHVPQLLATSGDRADHRASQSVERGSTDSSMTPSVTAAPPEMSEAHANS